MSGGDRWISEPSKVSLLRSGTFGWIYLGVEPKIGVFTPPNHPLKNRVFHYFHHPFWG